MRYFCVVDVSFLAEAESAAVEWDVSGDGSTTFEQGARLSSDGGDSITHRACNTLVSPIDASVVVETLVAVSAMDLYRLDKDLPVPGAVDKLNVLGADAWEWNAVGNGDLQNLALSDAGLVIYETELVAGVAEWEPGVDYAVGDQASYDGTVYDCIQAHTSQVGWEPPNVPALWEAV